MDKASAPALDNVDTDATNNLLHISKHDGDEPVKKKPRIGWIPIEKKVMCGDHVITSYPFLSDRNHMDVACVRSLLVHHPYTRLDMVR